MKRSLTAPYTLHRMAYWATAAGIVSFATAFLLQKGFVASTIGILLACGNLLSRFGITVMPVAGIAMAAAGTAVFFLTVEKKMDPNKSKAAWFSSRLKL